MSFTDSEGITHSVEVTAETLFEAAALGLAAFRSAQLCHARPRPGQRLTVAARQATVEHSVEISALNAWLRSHGSPKEQALKFRLRELLESTEPL